MFGLLLSIAYALKLVFGRPAADEEEEEDYDQGSTDDILHPQVETYDEAGRRRFNRTERLLLYENCCGKCFFCFKTFETESWSAVHLDPGARVECTVVVNGVAACEDCAEKKASLTHQEFVNRFGGKDGIPQKIRCHGFTPDLVRCEDLLADEKEGLFCSQEHYSLWQYMKNTTDSDLTEVEEVDAGPPKDSRRAFQPNQRKVIFSQGDGKCFYCNEQIPVNGYWEADHLIPHSKGGWTTVTNGVVACKKCNREKSASTHQQFMARHLAKHGNGDITYMRCEGFYLDGNSFKRCRNTMLGGNQQYCDDGACEENRSKVKDPRVLEAVKNTSHCRVELL